MSALFTHLKALRAKINSKIGKVRSSMHKNKAAVDEAELNAQPMCVKGKVQDSTTSDSEPDGEELQEIMVALKPNINGEEITAASKPIINGEEDAPRRDAVPLPWDKPRFLTAFQIQP